MPVRIAVDAMGGDHAPEVVVHGALAAVHKAAGEIQVILFGPEALLKEHIEKAGGSGTEGLTISDAPDVIGMSESPAVAVRTKQRSSIHLGLQAHKAGQADAFVSAGSTGAVMAASLFILGRLEGVTRPGVVGFFPTVKGYSIMVDVGANVDCKAEHLVQFAQMGEVYARTVMRRHNPVVALVNMGEEKGKGGEAVKAAYDLLEVRQGLNFKGNIEGRDIMNHAADVLVCDGFTGNLLLKFGESIASVLPKMIGSEMANQNLGAEHQQTLLRVLKGVQKRFDYEEYGGAPLLGVAGNVLIGHGGSSARAIERLIEVGAEMARENVSGTIAEQINQ